MLVGERPEGGVAATALAEVRVLGGFDVTVDRRTVAHADWQRLSAERLFKLLVVTPGHRVARELAAETLWPDSPPDTGRANLRKAIHFAHRALVGSSVLIGDARSVALDAESLDLDLDRLLDAFAVLGLQCRAPDGPDRAGRDRSTQAASAAAGALETVLELGPRELLPDDQYEDWLVGPRERLRSQWQRMAIVAAEEARRLGRMAQAHEIVDDLIQRDPTDESAHRLAIELYAAEGRHHAARRQYELCRAALRDGLDIEPSPETDAVFRSAERCATEGIPAGPRVDLVGRRPELERIETLFDRVGDGRLACLVIRGPAGIGKTRLLAEVGAYGRSARWQVIEWQAVEALRVEAFAPLRVALTTRLTPADVAGWREPARSGVGTLIPALAPQRLDFQDRPALVAALVAAFVELARDRPVVIAIDDVPWLDDSSLELLAALVAGASTSAVLIAATYRDDEPAPEAVRHLVEQMRRSGGLDLRLGPLARRDIDALVLGHLGGQALERELGGRVFEQSDGNPLFCLELMRAGHEHGAIRQRDGRWELEAQKTLVELPASARRIAAARSNALAPASRELLAVAAELGANISFDVLASALGQPADQVIAALDASLASGLLVESGGGYAFAHPLYRLAVRATAGPGRRALTHFAIARALIGRDAVLTDTAALDEAAHSSPDPTAVADHALAAAELRIRDAMPVAVAFGFAAGDRLVRLHDRAGAAAVLRRAVAVWRRLPESEARAFRATAAFIHLGHLAEDDVELSGASTLFREAIAAARDAAELAEAYDAFWEWVPYRRGDFERARAIVEEALARLPESATIARAHLEGMLGWTLVRLRRPAEALPILEKAAEVLDPSPDTQGAARALDSLGMTLHYLGRSEEGRPFVERALAIALAGGNTEGEIIGNLHSGVLMARSGQQGRARPLYERAAEICRLTGDAYAESLASWGVAEAADSLGDFGAARSSRLREVELLDRMGGNPHNAAMAHAHLANLARRLGDQGEAEREAAEARRLARLSPETGYAERIERAIHIERWADMDT